MHVCFSRPLSPLIRLWKEVNRAQIDAWGRLTKAGDLETLSTAMGSRPLGLSAGEWQSLAAGSL